MENNLARPKVVADHIAILSDFIRSNPDARALKRTLAVKMAIEDYPYSEIVELLLVNKSFISYCKHRFLQQGLTGIKLGYCGAQSYLTYEQRQDVIEWLRLTNEWNLDEIVTYVEVKYDVIYQSKQSYYALFLMLGLVGRNLRK